MLVKRLLIKGLGTSIIQVALYILLLYAGSLVAGFLEKPKHKGVDWGMTIYFSLILFAAVVLILNILTSLINRKWFTWIALSLTALFYLIGWGEDFDAYPNRTIYLLAIGLFCLIAKLQIDKRLERLDSKHYT